VVRFSKDCIYQSGSGALVAFDKFNGLMDRGVSGNPFEVPQLKDGRAECDYNGRIERIRLAAGVGEDQVIELRLVAKAPENNLRRKACVPGIQRVAGSAQSIRGESALSYLSEHLESDPSGGRNLVHQNAGHMHLKIVLAFVQQRIKPFFTIYPIAQRVLVC
jgi:hypothetical protein